MTVRTEANIRGGNIKKLKIKSGPSENKKKTSLRCRASLQRQ